MQSFKLFVESFLTEAKKPVIGIQHTDHAFHRGAFGGPSGANLAVRTLRGIAMGRTPLTRKIDDKMSPLLKRDENGRVGVKYKGPGSQYNYSNEDIERQHGSKPYLMKPLKDLLAHAHKVLPDRKGEWQGGYMSAREDRTESDGKISHTPNTVTYSVPKNSPEGQKLAKSKVSFTVHTELKGRNRKPTPVENQSEFRSHPDVHLVNHTVSAEERKIPAGPRKEALAHLSAAQELMRDHDYGHIVGHETHLTTYSNSTMDSGEARTVKGYKAHLQKHWQKEIDKVKTEKTKKAKAAQRDEHLAHVDRNSEAFERTFKIHDHLLNATNTLARSLNKTAHGGVETSIDNKKSGGEGFVAKGLKIVDSEEFRRANRARSAILRAKK